MDMKGAIKNFGPGEAMVQAFLAGNDILETFEDVPVAVSSLVNAVKEGRISDSLLTERVRKILIAKAWVGLNQYTPVVLEGLVADLNAVLPCSTDNWQKPLLNRQFAEATVTLAKNENELLPIRDLTAKIAVVSIDGKPGNAFQSLCGKYTRLDYYTYASTDSDTLLLALLDTLSSYDRVIVAAHLKEIRPSAKYSLTTRNIKAISQMSLLPKAVLCLFGNVYAVNKLSDLQNYKAIILAYQQWKYTEETAAQIIFGGLPSRGRLPVTLNDSMIEDQGVMLSEGNRLSYGLPAQVGFDDQLEKRIDSIVIAGLQNQAYPGAVVQVVRYGKTVLHKAYGNKKFNSSTAPSQGKNYEEGTKTDAMDYFGNEKQKESLDGSTTSDENAVSLDDYYDLASVTKVAATSLAIMQLMSEGKLRLDQSLGELVPSLKGSNKADLKMRDLLTHRAGLKAWIPFWHYAVDSLATVKKAVTSQPLLLEKISYTEKKTILSMEVVWQKK